MPGSQGLRELEESVERVLNGLLSTAGLPPVSVNIDFKNFEVEDLEEECTAGLTTIRNLLKSLEGTAEFIHRPGKEMESKEERGEEALQRSEGHLDAQLQEALQTLGKINRQYSGVVERCGIVVCGRYDCGSHTIILYMRCLDIEPCRDDDYLANRMLETTAHELVHHLQYNGGGELLGIPVIVIMHCKDSSYQSLPYRYRPHEAEAFNKMRRLAQAMLDEEPRLHEAILALVKEYKKRSPVDLVREALQRMR